MQSVRYPIFASDGHTLDLTVADAFGRFREMAALGTAQSLLTRRRTIRQRQRAPLPDNRVRVVLSYARVALESLSGAQGLALDQQPLLPLLALLVSESEHVGRRRAETGGAARSRKSNVALFVRTIAAHQRISTHDLALLAMPAAWQVMARALSTVHDRIDLARFQRIAQRMGIDEPARIPAVRDMQRWIGRDAEHRDEHRDELASGITAFRKARRRLKDSSLPSCAPARAEYEYGLRTLPFLAELMTCVTALPPAPDGPRDTDPAVLEQLRTRPAEVPARQLLALLTPHLFRSFEAFEQLRLIANNSPDYVYSAERAVTRAVASYARLLYANDPRVEVVASELRTLSLTHFWSKQWAARVAVSEQPAADPSAFADPDLHGLVADSGAVMVPLLRAIYDEMSRQAYRASPLTVNRHAAQEFVPLYTPSQIQGVRRLYAIAKDVVAPKLHTFGDEGRKRWKQIEFERTSLLSHMSDLSRQRLATGQVDKRLMPMHYAELVCRGLPALRGRVLLAEREQQVAAALDTSADRLRAARLTTRFHELLTEYMMVAIITAEGLREKNLRGARLGWHILPELDCDDQGEAIGIRRLITRFRGDDPAWVRLKQTHEPGGGTSPRARTREWSWPPGIVDHRLLFIYLRDVRTVHAHRAGLLPLHARIDLRTDTLALFISPRARAVRSEADAGGNFSRGILSDVFGRALFWMARDVLGRPGLPRSYAAACKADSDFRGLFGAHVIRSLGATWWGGLRNRWDFAEAYTNDLQPTLHAFYSKIPTWMARAVGSGGPQDPTFWNDVLDVIMNEQSSQLDWAGFWDGFDPQASYSASDVRARLVRER